MNTFFTYLLLGGLSLNSLLMFLSVNQYIGLTGLNVIINFIMLIIIGSLLIVKNGFKFVKWNYLDLIFYLFALFGIIASLVNSELIVLFRIVFYTVLYFVFVKLLPSIFDRQQLFNIFFNTLIVVYTLILLLPKVLPNQISSLFYYTNYSGLFGNTNHLGIASVTFLTILIVSYYSLLKQNKEKNKKSLKKLLNIILIIFTFLELITSSSRNALLSLLFVVIAFVFINFIAKIKNKEVSSNKSIIIKSGILILFTSTVLIYFESIYDYLYESILDKFFEKADDPLDGRTNVWSTIIAESSLFGNGANYVDNLPIAPHNTFMYFLAEAGWLTAILFLLIFIYGLVKSFKYYLRNNQKKVNVLPFLIIILFISLSLAENVYLHTITYLAFYQIGILFSTTNADFKKNKV